MSLPRTRFRWFLAIAAIIAGIVLAALELRDPPRTAFERWFWLGAAGVVTGFGAVELLALLRERRHNRDKYDATP